MNVVYKATCLECTQTPSEPNNVRTYPSSTSKANCYVAETSRSLYERSTEHVSAAGGFDNDNFIVKHWANEHPDMMDRPQFRFEVIRRHRDPMSRLLHEAIMIESKGGLNSKGEWNAQSNPGYKLKNLNG